MKLELKKETTETVELNPPMFWMDDEKWQGVALIDNDTVLSCKMGGNISLICNQNFYFGQSDLRRAISSLKQVSELEFLTWYDDLLQSISLEPKLIEQV